MSDYSFALPDTASTETHGAQLAALLRRGDVLLLEGDLGMGKTTLARGLIRALTHADENVVSPTFTLVQTYKTPQGPLYHYDLYRLEDAAKNDIIEIGWEDSLASGIVLVEWPERLGTLTPPDALSIRLSACPTGGRVVTYASPDPAWHARLASQLATL